jgi:RHS repeat-associated protein
MAYDPNGNTLNDGTNTYVWDARNRLVSVNSGGAMFGYDPLGRRASKVLLSATTDFLYDGLNPVQEQNGSTVTANLLTGGIDERFQRTDSSGTYSYLADALRSTEALTSSTGAIQASYTYSPYGVMSISGSTTNSYDYSGRESDGLGLHYYRARYYNPQTGRFLSEDPLGFVGSGTNFYSYADDSPANFVDPSGTSNSIIHMMETYNALNPYGEADPAQDVLAQAAALNVAMEDIGTQGTGVMDTRRHAMGGRKDNGNGPAQNPCQAYNSTRNFVNTTTDPFAAMHAIQDSYASGHQYNLWTGSLTMAHEEGDAVYIPQAVTATANYYNDLNSGSLKDASNYLSPKPNGCQ